MIIQIGLLFFIVYVISRVAIKYAAGDITVRELSVWVVFWLLVAAAVLWPKKTDVIAQYVGVERGADLLVYVSVAVLFFIVFHLLLRLKKMDQTITRVVRSEALKNIDHDK
jgi:hypothetical protein